MDDTLQLSGIHHLTAVTAQGAQNRAFYTQTLGLRLVKKTVNQDDVSAYHLFYADGKASPGTDITFFDWPAAPERRGTHSVVQTAFRVAGKASLAWWKERLASKGVRHAAPAERDGRGTLDFEDPEGRPLQYTAREESYSVSPVAAGKPIPEMESTQGVSGNFLLDPQLLVPARNTSAPLVLLD